MPHLHVGCVMFKRTAISLFCLLFCLSLLNCQQSRPVLYEDTEGKGYRDYDSPDNLIMNFTDAWCRLDIQEYRDQVLYSGAKVSTDALSYEPFKFYFIEPDDNYGLAWAYDEEVEHTAALFSGLPSRSGSLPGVEHIDLQFFSLGEWMSPENPYDVQGDRYPLGTLYRNYATDMQITLKRQRADTGAITMSVRDTVRFYVIPVAIGGDVEYRIWKWMDLDRGN